MKIKDAFMRTVVGFVFALSSAGVHATVIYEYTGGNFTDFVPLSGSSYDTSNFVEGYFTLADVLANDLPGFDISSLILDYSFSDGIRTFTQSTSFIELATVQTDASGDLIGGGFIILDHEIVSVPDTLNFMSFGTGGSAAGTQTCTELGTNVGGCRTAVILDRGATFDPGAWTGPTAVPEPGTLVLLSLGLAGLGFTRRMMKA